MAEGKADKKEMQKAVPSVVTMAVETVEHLVGMRAESKAVMTVEY